MASKYARDLELGDKIVLGTGRVVALHGVSGSGAPDYRVSLAYPTPEGHIEWHEQVPWDTRWTVVN